MATTDFQSRLQTVAVTIVNGTSLSAAVDLAGCTLVGIHMPAAWTAANLTFQASEDAVSFDNLFDAAAVEKTVQAAASRVILLNPDDWIALRYLKVRSGTSGAAVAQGADRVINLIVRPR